MKTLRICLPLAISALSAICLSAPTWRLSNSLVRFEFGPTGLERATDLRSGATVVLRDRGASVMIARATIDTGSLGTPAAEAKAGRITYAYSAPEGEVKVAYELLPGRRFLAQRVSVALKGANPADIGRVEPLKLEFRGPTCRPSDASESIHARFVRLNSDKGSKVGMFALTPNPFAEWRLAADTLSAEYSVDRTASAFESDWCCVGFCDITGRRTPGSEADLGEWAAARACVRALTPGLTAKPRRSHFESSMGDFNASDLSAYRRVIDRCAELGCEFVLFPPVAGAMQIAARDGATVDPGTQALIEYAKTKGVKLPVTVAPWADGTPKDDAVAGAVAAAVKRTGIGGVFVASADPRSATPRAYEGWSARRRMLQGLRTLIPDAFISEPILRADPAATIQDLHVDRATAFETRLAAYDAAVRSLEPVELLAGLATHFPGDASSGHEWDCLAWRYSLLSAIASAPFDVRIGALPARNNDEFEAMGKEDKAFLREWLRWPSEHIELAKRARPILGRPSLGKADGTSMIAGDHGFVFLFNPDYRRLEAEIQLDETIGLDKGSRWTVRRVLPEPEALLPNEKASLWRRGDTLKLALDGTSAMVLQIEPSRPVTSPTVFGVGGSAKIEESTLALHEVEGEPGTSAKARIALPHGTTVSKVTVNDKPQDFKRVGDEILLTVRFKDRRFPHAKALGVYDPAFAGRTYHSEFSVPKSVFTQLAARAKTWPVKYTDEELAKPWLGSSRLLLAIAVDGAEPSMEFKLTIDGDPVKIEKAWGGEGTQFLGFYADVSDLDPEERHGLLLTLPELAPGRFLGLFFENVETDRTDEVYAKGEMPPKAAGDSD